jgi:hypothetical protein
MEEVGQVEEVSDELELQRHRLETGRRGGPHGRAGDGRAAADGQAAAF